jgi:2-polyprenyl-6-methoxyphenol hydroxylase-like FAD-dependent oxidoreductase
LILPGEASTFVSSNNRRHPRSERAAGESACAPQQIFEDLGVFEALLPYDEGWPPTRSYDHDELVSETNQAALFPLVPPPYRPILMINQEHTEAVLRQQLTPYGRQIELGTPLVGFIQDAEHVVAQVTRAGKSEEIPAGYLVGCDGGRGTVRKAAGIPFLGETWDEEHFLLGNVSVTGLDTHYSYSWGGLGLTLQWMSHTNTWFFAASLSGDEHQSSQAPTLESLQRIFDERAGVPEVRFGHPRWLSVWRPNIRMVERYRAGRVFLAGDAAHVHSAAGDKV